MLKYKDEFLAKMRLTADPLADEVAVALFQSGYNLLIEKSYADFQRNSQSIPHDFPSVLLDYFQKIFDQHEHFDKALLKAGSVFFQKHAPALLASLGYLSLPYCYAAADGAQVLYMSERINKNPGKRLLETAQFVFDVCAPAAFDDQGKGLVSIAKVRLMHAIIRYHVLQSGKWDMKYGIPINQEDMAGTNLAFSLIAIRGLRKLGVDVRGEEALAYMALWNHIGMLGGVEQQLLPDTLKSAHNLDKMIAARNFRWSHEGQSLATALADYMDTSNPNKPGGIASASIIAFMVGEEVAQHLGLNGSLLTSKLLQTSQIFNSLLGFAVNQDANAYLLAKDLYKKQIGSTILKPFRMPQSLKD